MKEDDAYIRAIRALKKQRPSLEDKEALTREILGRIQSSPELEIPVNRRTPVLYGWMHHTWLKGAMSAAAVILAGIFIFQQLVIANRIDTLEKQLVRTIERINGQEPELSIVQKVMLKMASGEQWVADSVMVSMSDLEELLDAYQDVLEENENIREQLDGVVDPRK